jgi:hypothetical protein
MTEGSWVTHAKAQTINTSLSVGQEGIGDAARRSFSNRAAQCNC